MSAEKGESTKAYFKKLERWSKAKTAPKNHIVRVFLDTHMGYGHKGLAALAAKQKINVGALDRGEYVIFINRAQTALNLYTGGNCIAHLKMPGTAKIDMGVIRLIPSFFTGSQINYKGALKTLIKQRGY